MNTNFVDRIFRVSFILVFIVGMIVMPSTRAIAQSPCPSSMVSYWRADGNATDSIDSNDGILNGATYLAGKVGLSFDTNVNQYITVPDSPNLHIPQNMTIEAWINPSTSLGDRVILSKGNSNVGDGWHIMLRPNNTLAVHARYGTAWEITQTSDTIPAGTWHHIAYTYDGSQAKLYIDGVEKASRTFTAPIQQNTRPLKIGTVDQNIAFFIGLVDEVAIYNSVLSESELNGHYQSGMASASYCSIPSDLYNPWLEIWYPEDRIQVVDWPLNTTVSLTIDDDFDVSNGFLYENTYDRGNQDRIYIELAGIFDIQPGQVITVSDAQFIRFHQVTNLTVTGWNMDQDKVYGTAEPNTSLQMHAKNPDTDWVWRSTTTDSYGNWVFDFSQPGINPGEQNLLDVRLGTSGAATQGGLLQGDGGQTHFGYTVSFPRFWVTRDWNGLVGDGWPAEANLQVTADDPETVIDPDITLNLATNVEGFFEGDSVFPGLQPGWLITVTDGVTIKTHTVRDLSITDVDAATDIVGGTAYPNSEVWVQANYIVGYFLTVDGSGEWLADFSGDYDITPGMHVGVSQYDEDGDFTWTIQEVMLPPIPIPLGTSLTTPSRGTVTSGTPTVYWIDPLTVSTTGRSGGTGTATLTMSEGYVQTITLDETPPTSGMYMGTFAAPYPYHGTASISIAIHYPDGDDQQVSFTLYIDPSGVVRDTFGNPVVGATVTLYRSVDPGGQFVALSEGSAIMSPGNRTNPDLSGADGLFGWDVVAGFYKVRAEKAGCFSPTDPSQTFVESAVLTIPPPVTDLELILKCQEPPVASAGGPYTIEWDGIVRLDGSGSTDPDNDIAFYEWDLDGDGQYDDASGMTITTSFRHFGEQTIGLRVTDDGGLSDTDTATVTVLPWMLKGFYPPVDMNGVYNIVKKGSTVPFKFEAFAGLTELTDIAYVKSLTYAQTSCNAAATTDDIETTGIGGTSLRYDVMAGQFVYNWKMPSSAGKCYRVTMTAIDGSSLVAYFKLK